jgi:hypothetical protein
LLAAAALLSSQVMKVSMVNSAGRAPLPVEGVDEGTAEGADEGAAEGAAEGTKVPTATGDATGVLDWTGEAEAEAEAEATGEATGIVEFAGIDGEAEGFDGAGALPLPAPQLATGPPGALYVVASNPL